jgi:hypothetical protein
MKKITREDGSLFITGLHGCKCHPFNNWEENKKYATRKFKVGDAVQHRCFGNTDTIKEVVGSNFYNLTSFGLEHATQLKPMS